MRFVILFFVLLPVVTFSQDSKLSIFDDLVGKTWKADGEWGDGTLFKQQIDIDYALDSTIIVTNSIGFIDKEQTELGLRNHGIRRYDEKSDQIKFWEFDIFGGLTEGILFAEDKNIVYQYVYGDVFLTEMWEYLDAATYNYKIGIYQDGSWSQIYLSTQFEKIEIKEIED